MTGDVVELGCNAGVTSCMLQAILAQEEGRAVPRALHLFDSFEGLPIGDDAKGDPSCYAAAGGAMACSPKDVEANFMRCGLEKPHIHVGWFSETCPTKLPEEIAFAHLDGDLYLSIKESLELVYPKLSKGAIVVVDDYCDPQMLARNDIFPGALRACQEFFEDKPETIKVLPAPHPGYMDKNGFKFPAQYETHAFFEKL